MSLTTQRSRRTGENLTALCGGALAATLLLVIGLITLLAWHGLAAFWPKSLTRVELKNGRALLGEITAEESIPGRTPPALRIQLKVGNRDLTGNDFVWVDAEQIQRKSQPGDATLLERREWGPFYGRVLELRRGNQALADDPDAAWAALPALLARKERQLADIRALEKGPVGDINYEIHALTLSRRDPRRVAALQGEYERLADHLTRLREELVLETVVLEAADGTRKEIPVSAVVRALRPNTMGWLGRGRLYVARLWEFVSGEPRESNTEGGIFPAIFGTVMMVFLMAFVASPLGVLAAVYLREYARQGPLVRAVRIAVNNLAGVPSIVFGMFGLGFFVYVIGGTIDRLFFRDALPSPTFGTGGILWASLTLALLTVPVVIVAAEEGLAAVPRAVREGSMALGATKFETTWKIVVPAAAPGILTGMILAMARAAGEVAPLMVVGMVKLAPQLPVDHHAPFIHLERKFMHLGFHIYDLGFQSPNVEASKPLVFATALLLVGLVTILNLAAIALRNHLRRKYTSTAV